MSQETQALGHATVISRVRLDDGARHAVEEVAEAFRDEQSPVRELDELAEEEMQRLRDDPMALDRAVERMEAFVQEMGRDLNFKVDRETGDVIVTVKVSGSEEIVRQIPSEEMVALSKRMAEIQGMLFNDQA